MEMKSSAMLAAEDLLNSVIVKPEALPVLAPELEQGFFPMANPKVIDDTVMQEHKSKQP